MIVSETRYNQVVEKLRFDAEFYKPKFLEAEEVVKKLPTTKTVGELAKSIVNGVEIREYVTDGIPYLRVSDMKEVFIDISKVSKVRSNSVVIKDVKLEEGDLLFSRSGTLGIICVVTPEVKGSIISSHLIRVRLDHINPFYAVGFFNCKYGRYQILRRNNGAVVPEIDQPSLFKSNLIKLQLEEKIAGAIMSAVPKTIFGDLLIPILSEQNQKQISALVKQSFLLRKESKELLEKAKKEIEEFIEKGESKTEKDQF